MSLFRNTRCCFAKFDLSRNFFKRIFWSNIVNFKNSKMLKMYFFPHQYQEVPHITLTESGQSDHIQGQTADTHLNQAFFNFIFAFECWCVVYFEQLELRGTWKTAYLFA